MNKFITADQYKILTQIPRGRMAVRTQVFCGAIIEKDGKILMVRSYGKVWKGWDFPGGKMLWGENIFNCVSREVLEETGYTPKPKSLLGIYQRKTELGGEDYLRFIFISSLKKNKRIKIADPHVEKAEWINIDKLLGEKMRFRSEQVLKELKDYKSGKSFSLDVVKLFVW